MTEERRKHKRFSHPLEGSWSGASGKTRCRIGDISLGGCFVQSLVAAPSLGESTTITFEIGNHHLSLEGTVVYAEMGMGFAVRFGEIPREELEELARVLESLEKGQPGN